MASIDWPSSLPAPRPGTLEQSATEGGIRDSSEVGAPRARQRFTRDLENYRFTLLLRTLSERAVLLDFWKTDLVRGVEIFNFTDPVTSEVREVRLLGRPLLKHVAGDVWTAEVEMQEV